MRIAFVSPEVYPFAKTGGLADVSYSLPKALSRAGHEVAVFLPAYKQIDREKYKVRLFHAPLVIKMHDEERYAAILVSEIIPEYKVYFIDYIMYFGRDGLYGYSEDDFYDNAARYDFFACAVLEAIPLTGFNPEIIHCNDWQTGLIPYYLKHIYGDNAFYADTKAVFTVHNAGYRGEFVGYKPAMKNCNDNFSAAYDARIPDGISFLKAGVLNSDIVTTVSRKYAEEIKTREFGYDMADIFFGLENRLCGIQNAVDYEKWDPETDKNIPYNFSFADLSGKQVCKVVLQKKIGLQVNAELPLLGTIARLVYQKGMDVLADTLEILLQDEKFQFIIIGTGDMFISSKFERLKKMFPDKIGIFPGYDEPLEHLAEAGLDIFIMPSRYEPCGLNQLYSLKYGTVPVVRATGGLDEAIEEWNNADYRGNGFKFKNLTGEELYSVIRKVIKLYYNKDIWQIIQGNGMNFSYSWTEAAKEYEKVYKMLLINNL